MVGIRQEVENNQAKDLEYLVLISFYLLRMLPGNPVPLKEGLNPGGTGDICGNGKDEGGSGKFGRGPGNIL